MQAEKTIAADIIDHPARTIHFNSYVPTAAKKMLDYRSTYLIVVDGRKNPIGIVTERAFMSLLSSSAKRYQKIRIKDVMSAPLISTESRTLVVDCIDLMKKNGIKHIPLIDEGVLKGVITLKSVIFMDPSIYIKTSPIAMFVLFKKNGLPIFEYIFDNTIGKKISTDLFSGAISSFDAIFSEALHIKSNLKFIERENNVILMEHGTYVLAILIQDTESIDSRKRLQSFLQRFEKEFNATLSSYTEAKPINIFQQATHIVEDLFAGKVN